MAGCVYKELITKGEGVWGGSHKGAAYSNLIFLLGQDFFWVGGSQSPKIINKGWPVAQGRSIAKHPLLCASSRHTDTCVDRGGGGREIGRALLPRFARGANFGHIRGPSR